jgi:hypothetical protein
MAARGGVLNAQRGDGGGGEGTDIGSSVGEGGYVPI